MGTQLNIKSEDAYRLASRLSELTGESMTAVVTEALRERLDRQLRVRDRDARLERLRAITADIRAAMGDDLPTSDHSWLYDNETGLPR
jgi:antitoxin VapB